MSLNHFLFNQGDWLLNLHDNFETVLYVHVKKLHNEVIQVKNAFSSRFLKLKIASYVYILINHSPETSAAHGTHIIRKAKVA